MRRLKILFVVNMMLLFPAAVLHPLAAQTSALPDITPQYSLALAEEDSTAEEEYAAFISTIGQNMPFIVLKDNLLLLANQYQLFIYDFSDDRSPALITEKNLGPIIYSLNNFLDYLIVLRNDIDPSPNSSKPRYSDFIQLDDPLNPIMIDAGYLYGSKSVFTIFGKYFFELTNCYLHRQYDIYIGYDGIVVFHVLSDPPPAVGKIYIPGRFIRVGAWNEIIFAQGQNNTTIYDFSNPAAPVAIDSLVMPGMFTFYDDYAYISEKGADTKILDISDPYNYAIVAEIPIRSGSVKRIGGLLYDYGDSISVYNLKENPLNPPKVCTIPFQTGRFVQERNYFFYFEGDSLRIYRNNLVKLAFPDNYHYFANVKGNEQATADDFRIFNNTAENVTITDVTFDNPLFSIPAGTIPVSAAPYSYVNIPISFAPALPVTFGQHRGKMTVTTSSDDIEPHTLQLFGDVPPGASLSHTSYGFGAICIGDTSTFEDFEIGNLSSDTLIIDSLSTSSDAFRIIPDDVPVTLPYGESKKFRVIFSTESPGEYSENVYMHFNSGWFTEALAVTGTCKNLAELSAETHDFGYVEVSESATWDSLYIYNTSRSDLLVNGAVINNPTFSVLNPTFPFTIQPADSARIIVQFTPVSVKTENGTMILQFNSYSYAKTVSLTGCGTYATGIEEEALPENFQLHQNYPNPFNSETAIRFDLPGGCGVRIDIFDVTGRLVKTLADGPYPAGYHSAVWDGTNSTGVTVSSGIYFYRIRTNPMNSTSTINNTINTTTKKLVFVK